MDLQAFFATHPVFTYDELVAALDHDKPRSAKTRESLLAYHRKRGRILRVRRGLYCVVPPGTDPAACPVDRYLLAGKMTDDAVIAYHTALELHGKAHSVFEEVQYLTARAARPLTFRSQRFRPVRFPKRLADAGRERFSVEEVDRLGMTVHVTSLERTLVDVLDRPQLGGGWEELWRSLDSAEFFDLDAIIHYALLLDNATTVAKVGFFLEQHREALMVEESHLERLRARRPRQPHYLSRHAHDGRLVSEWNLIVPAEVLEQAWEEPG